MKFQQQLLLCTLWANGGGGKGRREELHHVPRVSIRESVRKHNHDCCSEQPRVCRAVPSLRALLYLVGKFAISRTPWKL